MAITFNATNNTTSINMVSLADSGLTAIVAPTAGQAISCDGTHYVTNGSDPFNGKRYISMSVWVYPTSNPTQGSNHMRSPMSTYVSASGQGAAIFQYGNGTGADGWYFGCYDGSWHQAGPVVLSLNTWHHIVGQKELFSGNDRVCIYTDGSLSATAAASNGTVSSSGNLLIGGMNGNDGFVGRIDEAAYLSGANSSSALSAAQITAEYNSGVGLYHTTTLPWTAVYHFDNSLDNGSSWTGGGAAVYAAGKVLIPATGPTNHGLIGFRSSDGKWADLPTYSLDLTNQTAAINATTLFTPAASGMFRIEIVLQITTKGGTSSVLGGSTGVVIAYTEADGSVAQSIVPLLTSQAGAVIVPANGNTNNDTLTTSQGSAIIYAKTGVAVTYAIGYTSVGSPAMAYSAHIVVNSL